MLVDVLKNGFGVQQLAQALINDKDDIRGSHLVRRLIDKLCKALIEQKAHLPFVKAAASLRDDLRNASGVAMILEPYLKCGGDPKAIDEHR